MASNKKQPQRRCTACNEQKDKNNPKINILKSQLTEIIEKALNDSSI